MQLFYLQWLKIIEFYEQWFATKICKPAQPAIACSKLTIETLEQGVKYVQS